MYKFEAVGNSVLLYKNKKELECAFHDLESEGHALTNAWRYNNALENNHEVVLRAQLGGKVRWLIFYELCIAERFILDTEEDNPDKELSAILFSKNLSWKLEK